MPFLLLHSLFYNLFLPFYNHFSTIFFAYYVDIAIILAVAIAIAFGQLSAPFSRIRRGHAYHLALLLAAFLALELLFVQPYHLLYNDEYIYMSMAKTMLTDHLFGICSFSTAVHCVPGTLGFFHQPGEWPVLLAGAFSIFGISPGTAYSLTLLLSALSIVLLFMIAYLLFNDERRALASSVAFASIPLFMSYSRTSIVDIAAFAALLLSILAFIVYSRQKSLRTGLVAMLSALFMLGTKIDMVYALPLLAMILLLGRGWLRHRTMRANLLKGAALLAVAAVAIVPQLGFLYYAQQDSFGSAVNFGQSKFSAQNFNENIFNNTVFWLGAFNSVRNSGSGVYSFTYHAEFPITVTAFAFIGALAMLAYGKRRELAIVLAWFLITFVFYTAYYAGNVTYGLGADVRY
ncbi:MAG: glycosyltransferase family 39 protein, partial [Candidatus Micrarchaeota archaeon]|nr:glycosyltransferase family 39 protein [Candidatus Micrarchaeota archaeon]